MIPVSVRLAALCGLTLSVPGALAGFDSGATTNIAIYWGQNSVNKVESNGGQERLAAYCAGTPFNIIPLAFMNSIVNPTEINFANAGDNCTTFPGTQLLSCPQLEEDIQTCQSLGKSILLSIGGATYTEGGFSSSSVATTWADNVWAMFGPVPSPANASVLRPFGNAVIDGFDMDLESTTSNMIPFVAELRAKMDAATASGGKKYFLSAAPQCPFPDASVGSVLNAVAFDFVGIQFYNNYCGSQNYVAGSSGPGNFNFDTWDNWAKTTSPNKNIKLLLGVPGSATAAGSGYVSGTQLSEVIAYSKTFSSFGGVMIWDMSQVYANTGFLASVVSALGSAVSPPTTTSTPTSTTTKPTTMTTVTRTSTSTSSGASPTGSLVPQWGQCGGQGYTGSTQCASPYKCVATGQWWSQCE